MKDYRQLRIVFMGTPEFAVASLDALIQAGCNIVGVVTAPDKAAGRGMKLTPSAVKQYALDKNLFLLQPEKLKSPEFLEQLKALNADLQIVVAFRMLPEVVWNMSPMGTINLHGSLLPAYRGAAPINWAIINGEKQTGVTTFKLQHAIDTGNVLMQEIIPIKENDNAGSLHDTMKQTGAEVLVATVKGLADGSLKEKPQEQMPSNTVLADIPHAPKIFTETCNIDWAQSCQSVHNLIRGLSPYPAAFTTLQDKKIKIFESSFQQMQHHAVPGSFETDGKTFLKFAAEDGYIFILELQMEGKKRMKIEDFLRGYRLQ